nr:hypothetical protein [uncultured bacterium]
MSGQMSGQASGQDETSEERAWPEPPGSLAWGLVEETGFDMPVRPDQPAWMSKSVAQRRREFALGVASVAVLGAATIGALVAGSNGGSAALAASAVETAPEPAGAIAPFDVEFELAGLGEESVEVNGEPERADGGCTIGALSLRLSASGEGVECLQDALRVEGHFTDTIDGEFADSTLRAAMDFQTAQNLFVDGVVGRETALALDIWPDEESLVTRTPPPAPGAKDLWGVELSPVASAGDDAPPLPENSGSGRRVVYDRAGQRVWAVRDDGVIIRSWLVSGSTYSNELPGTHEVYSRSDMSTAWNGKAWLPQMIRWLKTERGAIGFHAIPLHVEDDSPYQGSDELGTRLSGGCQRQHNLDAAFMWEFATIGTPVIVT